MNELSHPWGSSIKSPWGGELFIDSVCVLKLGYVLGKKGSIVPCDIKKRKRYIILILEI